MRQKNFALLAIVAFAAVAVAGVLLRPLLPIDETRYLSVAWEMHLGGDWLVPHVNGAIYTQKPPLMFWLINLLWAVTGVSGLVARLVAPAFAVASLIATGALARRLWPDVPGVGARAVIVLAGFSFFATFGGLTMFDTMLTLATLMGLIALVAAVQGGRRVAWVLLGAALALGVYAKGPVILLHLLPAVLFMRVWAPSPRVRAREVALGASLALAVALALVALWLVPAILHGGPAYRQAILWTQSAGRVTHSFAHARPWWLFVAALPLILFPFIWSPAVWRRLARLPLGEPGVRLCLIWGGAALVLFSLVSGKQLHYLLPELPAVALLLARAAPGHLGRGAVAVPALIVLAGAGVLLAAAFDLAPLGIFAPLLEPHVALVWLALAGAVLAVAAMLAGGLRGLTLIGLGVVALIDVMIAATGLAPAYDAGRIAALIAPADTAGIAFTGGTYNAEFNFVGRLRHPVAVLKAGQVAGWMAAHPRGALIARKGRALPGWAARARIDYRGSPYLIWFVEDRAKLRDKSG